jgi:sugar phosphate isomerase/epimerase
MAGIRPRELDRSARRDLAALLRRAELTFAGVDAFVPPEHLLKADMVDRAVSSILGAIDLAADLAALASGSIVTRMPGSGVPACVGVTLHEKTPADVLHSLADHATGRSVRIANHAWPIPEAGPSDAVIGIGLDPATAMASGADPVALAARLGKRVASARLSDVPSSFGAGGGRVVPGDGKLDVMEYLVTLATSGYTGHAVLDLRHLPRPAEAIKLVQERAITGM